MGSVVNEVTLPSRLSDQKTIDLWTSAVNSLICSADGTSVAVNFSNVKSTPKKMLDSLRKSYELALKHGVEFTLCDVNKTVKEVIELTGNGALLSTTVDTAAASEERVKMKLSDIIEPNDTKQQPTAKFSATENTEQINNAVAR